ncbi:MAG: hypothetical protein U1F11_00355 [Steroidobacteraceae bacterium]
MFRREFLAGTATATLGTALAATTLLAPSTTAARERERGAGGARRGHAQPVALNDAALLTAFMKLRSSTDGRLTIGWMDAVTHAFIEGEAFPLYRLLAGTWARYEKQGERYVGTSLEIAFFLDPRTGELLKSLTMPRASAPVAVPLYRAGPSKSVVAVRAEERREFSMNREARDGQSFFRPGVAASVQYLSQPESDGERFSVREDLGTRVTTGEGTPGFFYREFGIWRGPYAAVMNPRSACVETEVIYPAAAAFRPWMQMGSTPATRCRTGSAARCRRRRTCRTGCWR